MKHQMYKILLIVLLLSTKLCAQVQYTNPILAGFYPDPSICRVNNDYYLVTSSFAYFPGLPIFHSKDLVNWQQIGSAMNRNEQLDLTNAGISRGLFAPTIRYHNGTFYIICTLIDKGGNFIITAKDPKGPWSNPIWLKEVRGIDPSIFFDDDGKAYITYNSDPPDNRSLYDGHRTIRIITYDIAAQQTIGDNQIIVNGGVDITKKPIWIEAPHIYKKDGWYYLMCAEGGTGYNHSEVVFRSKTVNGPYIPFENNPILTQRHLDVNRPFPVSTAGHADIVSTPEGKWYAVFLGCRPYDTNYYNIGRETFLTPVEWKNGWPLIEPVMEPIKYHYTTPYAATKKINNPFSGNYTFTDAFNNSQLNDRYLLMRNPEAGLYNIAKGMLTLPLKNTTVAEKKNPAFIGFRQAHHQCDAVTRIQFNPAADNEKAGLIIFQNEQHYYFLCVTILNNQRVIAVYQSGSKDHPAETLLASRPLNLPPTAFIDLKISAGEKGYSFYFATRSGKWETVLTDTDRKFLSTKIAGGFVGALFGMYATANGVTSNNKAVFDRFEYKGNDAALR